MPSNPIDHYDTDTALAPTNLNHVAKAAPWLAQCAPTLLWAADLGPDRAA